MIIDDIKAYNEELFSQIVEIRRHIHKHPELSFREEQTASYIRNLLISNNIYVDDSFGTNAVIAVIGEGDRTIALRADLDALPIQETTNCEFSSQNRGVMHACGHDAHAASLVGTALIVNKMKHLLKQRVVFIFQPGEELCPGGASILIAKGLLQKYNISTIVGMHVTAGLATGKYLFGSGHLMAATNELYVNFTGKGGHAAMPEKRSDTVLALADFLVNVRKLQESLTDEKPFIVAFGKIEANGALNVIPAESKAEGTMRTFNPELHKYIEETLPKLADESAQKYKCKANFSIHKGYPTVYNNPDITLKVKTLAQEFVSAENIEDMPLRMTAEDFGFYSQEIPCTFFRVGIMGNGFGEASQHDSKFDLDEEVFLQVPGLMAFIALKLEVN